jgi:membrane protein implicated in regulation of membrane protease activity
VLGEQVITTETHVLRPHAHLFRSGLIAVLALTTPVFAIAYWLTIASGWWPLTIAIHVLVGLLALLVVLQYRRTSVMVSPQGVRERAFLGHVTEIANSDIGSLCLVEIYRDSALDTQPNLFILDSAGRPRIRLRGQYWSRSAMEDLAEVLDRPLVSLDESVTISELRSSRPEWLYWFERVPLLTWF